MAAARGGGSPDGSPAGLRAQLRVKASEVKSLLEELAGWETAADRMGEVLARKEEEVRELQRAAARHEADRELSHSKMDVYRQRLAEALDAQDQVVKKLQDEDLTSGVSHGKGGGVDAVWMAQMQAENGRLSRELDEAQRKLRAELERSSLMLEREQEQAKRAAMAASKELSRVSSQLEDTQMGWAAAETETKRHRLELEKMTEARDRTEARYLELSSSSREMMGEAERSQSSLLEGKLAAETRMLEAHTEAGELRAQLQRLKSDIEDQGERADEQLADATRRLSQAEDTAASLRQDISEMTALLDSCHATEDPSHSALGGVSAAVRSFRSRLRAKLREAVEAEVTERKAVTTRCQALHWERDILRAKQEALQSLLTEAQERLAGRVSSAAMERLATGKGAGSGPRELAQWVVGAATELHAKVVPMARAMDLALHKLGLDPLDESLGSVQASAEEADTFLETVICEVHLRASQACASSAQHAVEEAICAVATQRMDRLRMRRAFAPWRGSILQAKSRWIASLAASRRIARTRLSLAFARWKCSTASMLLMHQGAMAARLALVARAWSRWRACCWMSVHVQDQAARLRIETETSTVRMALLCWRHAVADPQERPSTDAPQGSEYAKALPPSYEVVALRKDVAFLKEQLHKVAGHAQRLHGEVTTARRQSADDTRAAEGLAVLVRARLEQHAAETGEDADAGTWGSLLSPGALAGVLREHFGLKLHSSESVGGKEWSPQNGAARSSRALRPSNRQQTKLANLKATRNQRGGTPVRPKTAPGPTSHLAAGQNVKQLQARVQQPMSGNDDVYYVKPQQCDTTDEYIRPVATQPVNKSDRGGKGTKAGRAGHHLPDDPDSNNAEDELPPVSMTPGRLREKASVHALLLSQQRRQQQQQMQQHLESETFREPDTSDMLAAENSSHGGEDDESTILKLETGGEGNYGGAAAEGARDDGDGDRPPFPSILLLKAQQKGLVQSPQDAPLSQQQGPTRYSTKPSTNAIAGYFRAPEPREPAALVSAGRPSSPSTTGRVSSDQLLASSQASRASSLGIPASASSSERAPGSASVDGPSLGGWGSPRRRLLADLSWLGDSSAAEGQDTTSSASASRNTASLNISEEKLATEPSPRVVGAIVDDGRADTARVGDVSARVGGAVSSPANQRVIESSPPISPPFQSSDHNVCTPAGVVTWYNSAYKGSVSGRSTDPFTVMDSPSSTEISPINGPMGGANAHIPLIRLEPSLDDEAMPDNSQPSLQPGPILSGAASSPPTTPGFGTGDPSLARAFGWSSLDASPVTVGRESPESAELREPESSTSPPTAAGRRRSHQPSGRAGPTMPEIPETEVSVSPVADQDRSRLSVMSSSFCTTPDTTIDGQDWYCAGIKRVSIASNVSDRSDTSARVNSWWDMQVQEWDRVDGEQRSASPARSASRSRAGSMAEMELQGEVAKVLQELADNP